jgi:hypothetical protein
MGRRRVPLVDKSFETDFIESPLILTAALARCYSGSCFLLNRLNGNTLEASTPKSFASSSPGFALKPWVIRSVLDFVATLKELRQWLEVLKSCGRFSLVGFAETRKLKG